MKSGPPWVQNQISAVHYPITILSGPRLLDDKLPIGSNIFRRPNLAAVERVGKRVELAGMGCGQTRESARVVNTCPLYSKNVCMSDMNGRTRDDIDDRGMVLNY